MYDIIVACTNNYGIGLNNGMAWKCPKELEIFREKTRDSVLIMGRKTVENLPLLKGRHIICVSRNENLDTSNYKNGGIVCPDLQTALIIASAKYPGKKIFVAGGAQIYNECFNTRVIHNLERIHVSYMKNEYKCDTFFEPDLDNFVIAEKTEYDEFTHFTLLKTEDGEEQYLKLLDEVYYHGAIRQGRNGMTKSLFTRHLKFNLTQGFPLLTTKKMFTRGILEELIFFLKGETDSTILEEKGVNIWKGNTSREFLDSLGMENRKVGVIGQMYGYQWRFYNAEYDENTNKPVLNHQGIDQLKNVIDAINTDPQSRRILLTSYNPVQAEQGVLYPCHSIVIQFYVDGTNLDMFCYNRSQDLFLGTPFNIASSAFLLSIIANICKLTPRMLNITLGDAHIYESHLDIIETQTERQPYKFPTMQITKELTLENLETLTPKDFVISNYMCYPPIKKEMVV